MPQSVAVTEGTQMTFHDSVDAAVDLADVAQDLSSLSTTEDVSARLTELAAKLFSCKASDHVRVDTAGRLRVLASSDPGLSKLTEAAWKAWPHHPVPARLGDETASVHRQRSSYRAQLHASTGVADELVVPLAVASSDHGHLRFLFAEPFAGTARRALIDAYAVHAALALDRVALVAAVANLEVALAGNRTIGAAVGVLMGRQNLTYDGALARLMVISQHRNRKLRDVAAEVLYTGEVGGPASEAETAVLTTLA